MAKQSSALVLVENEVTMGGEYDFWADDTGVQYQFPNTYKNRVQPSRPFIYYRGVRRASGKRGPAEYFGSGVIGDVWPDPDQPPDTPAARRRWFCAIESYVPFEIPVPAKRDGAPYEDITNSLGWRTGVREISQATYDSIVGNATPSPGPRRTDTPPASARWTVEDDAASLLLKRPKSPTKRGGGHSLRRSGRAKEIGDWAERLIARQLQEMLPVKCRSTVDWLAGRGETPGWDISYLDGDGKPVAVEVKATTLARFSSIEMTANEWRAAEEHGERYVLALVVRACTDSCRVAFLRNPAALQEAGQITLEPVTLKVSFIEDG